MKQMGAEKVYEAVLTVPYGKPWVPSHMILVRQRFADGSIKKYKARLVAGGHRQKFTSYEQTSSPTARLEQEPRNLDYIVWRGYCTYLKN